MVKQHKEPALVAQDIMASPVICVNVHECLADVEQRLIDAQVTGVPVVEEGRLLGIITRSDYVRIPLLLKALDEYVSDRLHEDTLQQQGREEIDGFRSRFQRLTVSDVMTRELVTCAADTPVSEVAAKMIGHHVHRIIVVDGDKPVGIVGSLDLVKLLQY